MLILANPLAGRGYGRSLANAIRGVLRRAGHEVVVDLGPPQLATPARRPATLIVVGGDGTLRAAVERMMALYAAEAPPILTVPMGTANLVAQYLGVPRRLIDVGLETMRSVAEASRTFRRMFPPRRRIVRPIAERVLKSLERHEITRIDAGLANGRLFLIMAGVGFDAHIVHELARRRTGPISLASYALPAATAVARYAFPVVRVELEGRRVFEREGVVMVANLPQYGTGFPIVPGSNPNDGKLDVVCLPCESRVRLLELLALTPDGRHLKVDGVFRGTARTLRISADREVPVQIDGDPGGSLPLHVSLAAQQIALIRPVTASPGGDDRAGSAVRS